VIKTPGPGLALFKKISWRVKDERMENSIYLGLSKQMVLRTNMDIVANNVANINTPGFRAQNLLFEEYISDPRGSDTPLSFVIDRGQYQATTPGPVKATENPLDVALVGPGFIGVQSADGKVAYTRAGNFQIGTDGALLTAGGFPVAGNGGSAITIPAGSSEISIDNKGAISNQGGQIGQLMIVEFENLQDLKPLGNNMYTTDAATTEATNTTVKQGFLEGSNVQPVIEITRMIETLRSFQSVQRVLETENERLRTAIQKLTEQS
jgi:flagellar basal-body rod protein FlgF